MKNNYEKCGYISRNNESYRQKYEHVRTFFLKDKARLTALKFIYRTAPLVIAAVYILTAVWLLICMDSRLIIFTAAPFTVFMAASVIRRAVNKKRPYEGEDAVIPLIGKDKSGRSFPSRHALSAALIASFSMLINIYIGIAVTLLSLVVAVTRVLAGVHYPSDVICGLFIGYAAGAAAAALHLI